MICIIMHWMPSHVMGKNTKKEHENEKKPKDNIYGITNNYYFQKSFTSITFLGYREQLKVFLAPLTFLKFFEMDEGLLSEEKLTLILNKSETTLVCHMLSKEDEATQVSKEQSCVLILTIVQEGPNCIRDKIEEFQSTQYSKLISSFEMKSLMQQDQVFLQNLDMGLPWMTKMILVKMYVLKILQLSKPILEGVIAKDEKCEACFKDPKHQIVIVHKYIQ